MDKLYGALERLIALVAAWMAGFANAKANSRADVAESDLAAYRERKRVEAEVAGLPDSALDNELRNPPK